MSSRKAAETTSNYDYIARSAPARLVPRRRDFMWSSDPRDCPTTVVTAFTRREGKQVRLNPWMRW